MLQAAGKSGLIRHNHSTFTSTKQAVKKLDVTYRMAWYRGLKTTYYLRSLAATGTEKSTIETGQLNAVSSSNETLAQPAPVPQACSLDDPDCEACQ